MSQSTNRFNIWLHNLPIKDPVDRSMARLLQYILLGFMGLIIVTTLLNLFVVTTEIPTQAIVIQTIIVLLVIGVPLGLLRRGHYRFSAGVIIALLLFVVAYALTVSNLREIAETLSFLTLAILMAGLLVSQRALILTFFLAAGIVSWSAVSEIQTGLDMGGEVIAFNFILLNGLMSMFLGRFRTALRNALARAQAREVEIQQLNTHLERRVQERTAQLERANQELEAFTYTVSHDLRTPLRGISTYTNFLKMELGDQLDEGGQRNIKQILVNVERMDKLIDDLLALSRVSRQRINKETVAPARLCQEILKDYQPHLDRRQVDIQIANNLPTCEADPALLRQVFANLLDNAIKYSRGREGPRVEVGWQEEKGERVYFVRDNGAGFDMAYADKLFGVFQRLHREDEFEGTGVGLATVQRILVRHGGRIWAEAEVDKGATFYFTVGGG